MTHRPESDLPPRWAEQMLRVLLEPRDRDTIAGDLLEEYREVVLPTRGRFRARLWYLRQMLSFCDGITLGVVVGAGFGAWNLIMTRFAPLAEDTPFALASFYGPMFVIWGAAGFATHRRTGRLTQAVRVGGTVGFVTFGVFAIAVLVRANTFLDVITQRSDWQGLLMNYQASGFGSLRAYVNYVYVVGIPLTMLIGAMIGVTTGFIGGLLSGLRRKTPTLASS